MADKFIKGLTEKTTWVDDDWIVFQPDGESSVAYRIKRSNLTFILKSLFNAHTILQATANNTPVAITIEEQRIIGRLTSGNIKGLTASETRTLLGLATTDSPQFAAVDVAEIANSGGVLKLNAGAEGDAEYFGDADVESGENGKRVIIHRREAGGDTTFEFFISQFQTATLLTNQNLGLSMSGDTMTIDMPNAASLHIRNKDDSFLTKFRFFPKVNSEFRQYGLITAASGDKYISWEVDDATDKFILDREDSNILGFKVNMPLEVNGGVQIGTDADGASAAKVGTIRYRSDANNSYVEMVMQTGSSTYTWEVIKTNSW